MFIQGDIFIGESLKNMDILKALRYNLLVNRVRQASPSFQRINSRDEENQEKDFEIVEVDSLHTQRRCLSDRQDLDYLSSEDPTKPELTDQSSLLHIGQLCQLNEHLPARLEQCPWSLVYSTQRHGTSLGTLYKSMGGMDCSTSTLTVIRDNCGQVFGAFCPTTLRISLSYYGTGHTFLFSFSPQLQVYKWKFSNSFFVKGSPDYLAFGGGGGLFGLWLDDGLIRGQSHRCDTFDNDVLSSSDDFLINDLEVWAIS
ncbi:TLD domain-containing protein 2-like isoform X1 [Oncorhynchus clarkii lewisi]|uniref:TLD domain-containing protein 2-like isoform X1 n=1 Tax=Oncorhynchus clarkii lewisi TaxID=490388 RepID=UPI0039B87151